MSSPWTTLGRPDPSPGNVSRAGVNISRAVIRSIASTTTTPYQIFTRSFAGQHILAHITINVQATTIAQTITFYDVDGTDLGNPVVLTEPGTIEIEYGQIAAIALSDANNYTVDITSVILTYDDPEKFALAAAKFRIRVDYSGPSTGGGAATLDADAVGTYMVVPAPFKMMGLGSTLKFTPKKTGIVFVSIVLKPEGVITAGTQTNVVVKPYFGTGGAPIQGAATTGTAVYATAIASSLTIGANANGDLTTGITLTYALVGANALTPGTAYWFDVAVGMTGTGGSATLIAQHATIMELAQ